MASVEVRHGSKGTTFRVKWRANGHQRSRSFSDRGDAEHFCASLDGSVADARTVAGTAGVTLDAWFQQVMSVLDRKPKTMAGYESLYRIWIRKPLGHLDLATIQPMNIMSLLADMHVSGARRRQVYALLSMLLNQAVVNDLLAASPIAKVERPRVSQREQLFLTPAQVHALADATRHYGTLVRFMAYSGLRWGEAMGLDARDVSPGRITVRRSVVEVSGRPVVGTPKSHQARTIGLPRFVTDSLPDAGTVFLSHTNGRISHGNFTHRFFKPAATSIGLPQLRIHDLRHTNAAWLVQAGVHPKAMQAHLGHSSIKTTLDTYGHLFDDHTELVANALTQLGNGTQTLPEALEGD